MYTSFGYGTESQDDRRVLNEVRRVLRPDGFYLLDLINWTLARRAFDGKYEESYPNFDVVEECRIDHGTDILRVRRALLYRDGRRPHIYSFEIRMFDQAGLTDLLKMTGFRLLELWGDFDRSPYSPQKSYRMIAVCRGETEQ
jgi:SAM-dependent methyltransferase